MEDDLRRTIRGATGGVAEQAAGGARAAGEVLGGLVLLLFTLFFVLKDGAGMADWLRARLDPSYREDAVALTNGARFIIDSTCSPPRSPASSTVF